MMLLKLFECFFVVLFLAFLITEVIIPMSRSLPPFPSFNKKTEDETKKKKGE